MRARCPTCGGRLDEDGACRRCELDPVPLDDADLGIRREDRYVALPPGPRWVRRRTPRESPVGPLLALVAAVAVLLLVVTLGPSDRSSRPTGSDTPLLTEPTGLVVVRAGPWGAEEIVVDTRRIRSVALDAMPPPVGTELDVGSAVLVGSGPTEVRRDRCDTEPCVVVRHRGELRAEVVDPVTATLSPDGDVLALLATGDPSILVELDTGRVTTVPAGAAPRGLATWSPDGEWLFFATQDGRIDAVGRDGERFRVPVGPRTTDTIGIARATG